MMTTLVNAGASALGERPDAPARPGMLKRFGALCFDLYRRGGLAMVLAAPLVALVVVPEFAQHVVEIKIGMFASIEGARAHSADSLRMGFGMVKIAGLVLAILAIARFWWTGSAGAAVRIPPRALLRTLFGIALLFACELPFDLLRRVVPAGPANVALAALAFVPQFLGMVYIVGALFGDRAMTLRRTLGQWRAALLLLVLMVLAYGPCFALHMATHKLALGQPEVLIWAIMTFDALVVGMLASLAGTALALGYAAGTGQRLPR